MQIYWRILSYVKPYWKRFAFALLCMVILSVTESFNITLISPFLKIVLLDEQPVAKQQESPTKPDIAAVNKSAANLKVWANNVKKTVEEKMYHYLYSKGKSQGIKTLCILILILMFISSLFGYIQAFVMASLEQAASRDIRNEIVSKYLQIPLGFYDKHHSGDLISRLIGDMTIVNNTIARGFTQFLRSAIQLLVIFVFLMIISWKLLLFSIIVLPPIFLIINILGRSVFRKSGRLQRTLAQMTQNVSELLGGIKIVQAYGAEKQERAKFMKINNHYYRDYIKLKRLQSAASPSTEFLSAFALIALLWFGGQLVISGQFDATLLLVFLLLMSQMLHPAKTISQVYSQIQQGMAAMQRVLEVIDIDPAIKNPENPVMLQSFAHEIKFDNVTFEYEKEKCVLQNLSFTIPNGQVVALVGHSGAGKTTIANLLPRFYDVSDGQILFDGVDIRKADLTSLRSQISMVTQDVFLSSGSIIENIAFGDANPDMDRIMLAAKHAYAYDFIQELPRKFETETGERGVLLSGGQRQRIAIARALYRNTPLLILDEATSNLDSESEALIQQAFTKLMENRTTLVIAHRISTIQRADNIIVLDKGKIIQSGKHAELITKDGVYQRLYNLQFNNE